MTPEQFCYWLQGYAELSAPVPPTAGQWQAIREHLALVFDKVTPEVELNLPPLPDIKHPQPVGPGLYEYIKNMPSFPSLDKTTVTC